MEEENNPQPVSPEEIVLANFPTRLERLQKQYKRLDVPGELNAWSDWMTLWSKEVKKELSSNPEVLYQFFKKRLKKAKPRIFKH
jgi:uncharacterized protein (DUF849 family)